MEEHEPKRKPLFLFSSPLVYIDPLHTNLAVLFVQLFRDSLNEYAYDADLAGLKYNLNSTAYGISVSTPDIDLLLK